MKHKGLFITTIIFFLLANTTYYWQTDIGMFGMLSFILLILYFFVLTVFLIRQTYLASKENFNSKQRLSLIGLMTIVLTLSYFFPGGIINFDRFERNIVFKAQGEGAANCTTTLKLKADKTFMERNVCFGITEIKGTYTHKGDTLFFDNISFGRHDRDFYKFAVIMTRENMGEKYLGDLVRFKDYADTKGRTLRILQNDLTE